MVGAMRGEVQLRRYGGWRSDEVGVPGPESEVEGSCNLDGGRVNVDVCRVAQGVRRVWMQVLKSLETMMLSSKVSGPQGVTGSGP